MEVDRVIAGKYRLMDRLSKGGMGSVWRAQHLELNSPAAVKLLDPAFADSSEALTRFKREAQSAASLRSANIVQIFDFGVDAGMPYIAMELLRGQSLAERLAEQCPLPLQETVNILSQVARAVSWAHGAGIIHRDLKPGNIFLSEDAGENVVKLVDFGIAKPAQLEWTDASVTQTGAVMGTPQYMSPEQASGRRAVDHRTDIWSFGIIAFECLTGYHAFGGETLGALLLAICTDPLPVPSQLALVPTGFDEWFARCAHRDPARRFPSIAAAADRLRSLCGPDVGVSPQSPRLDTQVPATLQSSSHPAQIRKSAVPLESSAPTSAPSMLTLASRLAPHRGRWSLALLGGLLVTGALVASFMRISTGSRQQAVVLGHALRTIEPPRFLASLEASSAADTICINAARSAAVSTSFPTNPSAAVRLESAPAIPRANDVLSKSRHASAGNTKSSSSEHDRSNPSEHQPTASSSVDGSSASAKTTVSVIPLSIESVESEFGFNPKRTTRGNR